MVSGKNLAHKKGINSNDVQANKTAVSVKDGEVYELGDKLKKKVMIAWGFCVGSLLLIIVSISIMSKTWYPSRVLQGWPTVISILIFVCSLIVAINQSVKYQKLKRAISVSPKEQLSQLKSKSLKHSSANSIVSLVCAVIPIIVYSWYLINVLSKPRSYSDQSGWIIVIYYWTIGFWLIPVWLVCGIFGLKSEKRKTAIISLIIKPVGFVLFLLALGASQWIASMAY